MKQSSLGRGMSWRLKSYLAKAHFIRNSFITFVSFTRYLVKAHQLLCERGISFKNKENQIESSVVTFATCILGSMSLEISDLVCDPLKKL